MSRVREIFTNLMLRACEDYPVVEGLMVHRCKLADREHRKSSRQYMHVGHIEDVICYAQAAEDLPEENLVGLIAHEMGHIVSGSASQRIADATAGEMFGAPVLYDLNDVEFMLL